MPNRSKFFEPLATAVASGNSIKASAELVGCSSHCAYNLSCTAEFKNRVSEIRHEITFQSVGLITQAATLAARTLVQLLSDECEPSIRLNASKAILASLSPLTELGELRRRIEQLEKATS